MANFFQRLFGRREPTKEQNEDKGDSLTQGKETRPLSEIEEPVAESTAQPTIEPVQLNASCAQSVGLQRDHNEDALFMLSTTISNDDNNMPFGLYIVADGMGGHSHGEVASDLAVRAMGTHVIGELYNPLLNLHPSPPAVSIQEIMSDGIQIANQAILKEAEGGGTTLTAVLIRNNRMTFAHVGDSRAYSVSPDGHMEALTRDHSLVERMLEQGLLTSEQAANHPQRNILYRALGQGEPFEADISTLPLPTGGYIMICSDGLWGVVPESKLSELIRSSTSLQEACLRMVDAANQAGGPDNITVILIRLPD